MIRRFVSRGFPLIRNLCRGFADEPKRPIDEEPVDFVQRDFDEMKKLDLRMQYDSAYLKIMDAWQKPLEKKRRRQERIAAIKEAFVPPEEQEEKLIVHNPALPISLPPRDDQLFAVVNINGSQHKVMQDDIVLSNYLKDYDINQQIVFDSVLLIGTPDFTLLGRPQVKSAKVYATVEEQTEMDKCIVFKKKRRKTYQKTIHFRHMVTVLRINKVELDVPESLLQKAVSL